MSNPGILIGMDQPEDNAKRVRDFAQFIFDKVGASPGLARKVWSSDNSDSVFAAFRIE
jgi:hypothetical protein